MTKQIIDALVEATKNDEIVWKWDTKDTFEVLLGCHTLGLNVGSFSPFLATRCVTMASGDQLQGLHDVVLAQHARKCKTNSLLMYRQRYEKEIAEALGIDVKEGS